MRSEAARPHARVRFRLTATLALALALVVAARPATPGEPRRLTVEEALALAENAPLGREPLLDVERVRAEGRGAGLWPNPELQLDREAAGEEVERVTALSLGLPLSGRLGLERSAASKAVTAAERRARQERIARRARVREAFLELLAAQERERALEAGLGRLDGLVRVLQARETEGESSGYDRMRAEQEQADLTTQALDARASRGRARSELAALLGLAAEPVVAEGSLQPPPTSVPPAEEARAAAGARGDVEAFAADAEERDFLSRAAGRRALPEPAVLIGRKTVCAGALCDSGTTFGLAVSLPLFDHGQGPRAAFRVEAQLARTRHEMLAAAARAEADAARAEVQAGRDAEAALARAPSSERVVRIAQATYEGGEMRIFELLDAYRTSLAAELRATEVRLSARLAEIRLSRAMGIEAAP